METKKISELTEVTSPIATDVFPIVNDGETKKVQLTNVKTVLGVTQAETDIDGLDTRLTTAENGWVSANETWTYASVDDPTGIITINADVTTKYSLGMRIKFTNGGNVIYGIITKISYSSPNTTLTFLHEIDPTDSLALHLMTNSAIANNYYSSMKVPYGFPINPNKWTIQIKSAGFEIYSPATGTWYNTGIAITLPIGIWELKKDLYQQGNSSSSTGTTVATTLSTTTNRETDTDLTSVYRSTLTQVNAGATFHKEKVLEITTATTYNLLIIAINNSTVILTNVYTSTILRAVCAYL